jgi:hypothetical protein
MEMTCFKLYIQKKNLYNLSILQIKQKALVLAEMDNFYKKRVEEDERLKNEMEGIFDTLNKYVSFQTISYS